MSEPTEPYTEYGLQAPNGQVSWGTAVGRPINTEAERQVVVLVLRRTAEELGYPEDEFLSRFRWVPRTVQILDRTHAVDDAEVAPPIEVAPNGQ
jgi:hypothetical protein